MEVGTHRIDGAIAALTPLGYPNKVIRDTVKMLLKAYGDDEAGWYFVEENYYQLLIDTISEEQDEKRKQQEAEKALVEARTAEISQQPLLQLADSSNNTDIPSVVKPLHENTLLKPEGPYGTSSSQSVRRPCYGWVSEEED